MQTPGAQNAGIGNRAIDTGQEVGTAARHGSQATLTGLHVARDSIEEHLLQTVGGQHIGNRLRLELIREQELDRSKPILGGSFEALEEGMLGVHHRQVGSEPRHQLSGKPALGCEALPLKPRSVRARPCDSVRS